MIIDRKWGFVIFGLGLLIVFFDLLAIPLHLASPGFGFMDIALLFAGIVLLGIGFFIILSRDQHSHIIGKIVISEPVLVVGGITLFGALLRLYLLGFKSFWYDEAVLYWISKSSNLQNILFQNATRSGAPPLFPILLHIFQKLGDSETILRLLPWIGGVVVLPIIYVLGSQFLEKKSAYILTFIVAIATTQVQYSQQLREYSLVFLLATIMLLLFYKQVSHPSWRNQIFLTIVMVISIFLQYGLALLIIALNIVFFIEYLSKKDKHKLFMWIASQLIVFCAVIIVYLVSLKQQMVISPGKSYLSSAYWDGTINSLLGFAVSGTQGIINFTFPGTMFIFVTIIGIFSSIATKQGRIALMLLIFPILVTFVAACAKLYPYLGIRQDIYLTPMIFLIFAFGVEYLFSLIQKKWVVYLIILFIALAGIKPLRDYLNSKGIENMRPIPSAMSSLFEKEDKIYIYYGAEPAFTYYYRINVDSQIFGVKSRENSNVYFQEIDELLSSNKRIWMVFSHCYGNECEMIPKYVSKTRPIQLVSSSNGTYLYLIH